MWSEFEWENKVAVNTDVASLREFLAHVRRLTNMRCVRSEDEWPADTRFLSANLYGRSVFGECSAPSVVSVCCSLSLCVCVLLSGCALL